MKCGDRDIGPSWRSGSSSDDIEMAWFNVALNEFTCSS